MQKFKALADDTRIRLLSILNRYEFSVNELVGILEMGQSRISRHLKVLSEAGLLRARKDGLWTFYTVPADGASTNFIRAISPFFPDSELMRADLDRAALMLEERVHHARQFFNTVAEKWDDLNREILGAIDLPELVLEAVPAGCHVAVDLGCGTGAVVERLCHVAGLTIGVDGSPAMLDLCRKRLGTQSGDNYSLRIGELSHLPLADGEADFACINLVLHHLPRPKAAFADIRRVLKPGSLLFVADFLKHQDETMRTRYGDHWLGFSREELEAFLGSEGFSPISASIRIAGRNLELILLTARREH